MPYIKGFMVWAEGSGSGLRQGIGSMALTRRHQVPVLLSFVNKPQRAGASCSMVLGPQTPRTEHDSIETTLNRKA